MVKDYEKMLEQLKNGEIQTLHISKEEFLQFRSVLVNREDFKHFRGEAQQGGDVFYTYLEIPRA